ncbi:zinc finger protein ZAT1-like [Phalaenopsis equestris]|uniref:zinc finger protein ZAT1-like n=1 Tax=Phalaenopsis equestris TaxID=78828 RepID=UPI0009E5A1FA|nr:zinc finger protein ZAT1-like [Phalaenopsis equestris]
MEAHSCKVCKRTFANSRSLGGHMRSHFLLKRSFNLEKSSEGRYGLRKKPKISQWFGDEDTEQGEKESWSTRVDDGQEEEMDMQTECQVPRNKRQGRRSKLIEALLDSSSSPEPTSPEFGALCLMLLSRGESSVAEEKEIKISESDIFRIGIKKADFIPSESGFRLEENGVEFTKDVNFAAVPESRKRKKSTKRDFDTEIEKRSKYECLICSKSFPSYQALGGHCSSHKKIRAESSSAVAAVSVQLISQKVGGYVCPICNKVFPSGQALGGHKRSHLIAGNSAASAAAISTEVTCIEQKNSKLNSLDLNLPASDFEFCDSFDSNGSIAEEKPTSFQENADLEHSRYEAEC